MRPPPMRPSSLCRTPCRSESTLRRGCPGEPSRSPGTSKAGPRGPSPGFHVWAPRTARSTYAARLPSRSRRPAPNPGTGTNLMSAQYTARRIAVAGRPRRPKRRRSPPRRRDDADALEHSRNPQMLAVKDEEGRTFQRESEPEDDRGARGPSGGRAPARQPPCARRRAKEKAMETPTMKRKNGKIVSVEVQPCHSAWRSGG